MNHKSGVYYLLFVAVIAFGTALAHFSCIFLGPACYELQMAPQSIIESAVKGTIFAPLMTIAISSVFVIVALYALSAARLIKHLPLLKLGVYVISIICILRGLLPIAALTFNYDMVTVKGILIGFVWLATGSFFIYGFRKINADLK